MTACFFLRWSRLGAGSIFRFVLVDISAQFSRSIVKAPTFYCSAFTQTDLHASRSVWSYKCNSFFPPWRSLVLADRRRKWTALCSCGTVRRDSLQTPGRECERFPDVRRDPSTGSSDQVFAVASANPDRWQGLQRRLRKRPRRLLESSDGTPVETVLRSHRYWPATGGSRTSSDHGTEWRYTHSSSVEDWSELVRDVYVVSFSPFFFEGATQLRFGWMLIASIIASRTPELT